MSAVTSKLYRPGAQGAAKPPAAGTAKTGANEGRVESLMGESVGYAMVLLGVVIEDRG